MTEAEEPDGVPAGFAPFVIDSRFVNGLGPLWVAQDPVRLGLVPDERHANIAGLVHGGMLATLADVALFAVATGGKVMQAGVTVTLSTSFVAPAHLGRFLHAEGRVVRGGRSIVFVDGDVVQAGEVVATFSGTVRRLSARPDLLPKRLP